MAVLSAADRRALPDSAYALPGKRFPIPDENHARAALSMLHHASPAEQAIIKRKVASRFPKIAQAHEDHAALVARLRAM